MVQTPDDAPQQAPPAPVATGDRPAPVGDRPPYGDRSGPRAERPRGGGRGRYTPRRRACQFCVDKVKIIDYKDLSRLRRFVSDRGKIEPRRKTSTCASHQRKLAEAMKRARHMALIPYTGEHVRATGFFPTRG